MHVGNAKLGWGSIWVHDGFGKTVTKEKYVGDVLSADGSNTDQVKERTDKGFGIVNEIMSILSEAQQLKEVREYGHQGKDF